jgi:uncharacterized membrane protein
LYLFILAGVAVVFVYLSKQINKQTKRIEFLELEMRRLGDSNRSTPPNPEAAQPNQQPAPLAEQAPEVAPVITAPTPPQYIPTPTGPWPTAENRTVREPVSIDPPKAFVFREQNTAALSRWLKENWFYAVAAVSLALAAVFFVQYGMENGLLSPFWRVMGALTLGAVLIGAGEWVRRRSGDESSSHTAYLPSTFSGAGVVALFVGVLAARQLYGLIGPQTGFMGLLTVSIISVVLGWYYGPVLTVVGILGATASPFLVGGGGSPHLLFYFFALIAIVGLLIDTIKHWAWPSVMALIATYSASVFLFNLGDSDLHFLAFALIVAVAAVTIPVRKLWPDHDGPMMLSGLIAPAKTDHRWPEFPTRLAFGAFAATSLAPFMVVLADRGEAQVLLALLTLALLYLATVIWFRNAPALTALALIPPILLLLTIVVQASQYGSLFSAFQAAASRAPGTSPPTTVIMLVGVAMAGSALAFWRGRYAPDFGILWAAGAALFAPLTIVLLEASWQPAAVIGAAQWAIYPMVVAAMMTLMAERIARIDGENRLRTSFFAMAALTMMSLSLILLFSSTALTLMLAVMVLLAAQIDAKFNLPLLSIFVQIGVAIAGWRLIADPGIIWAVDAPVPEMLFAYGGVIVLLAAAWFTLKNLKRNAAIVATESAVWSLSATLIVILIYRIFDDDFFSFWGMSLTALVWLISAAVQVYRLKACEGLIRMARITLASLFTGIGSLQLLAATLVLNPLIQSTLIQGPPVFDTLLIAYGVPALLFAVLALKLGHIRQSLRQALISLSAAYTALYLGLEIRRFWRGDDLSVPGTTGPELYTYTVIMLIAAVGLLFFAFSRRSKLLYQIAVIGVGVTIAKVFLIDMSGLSGLIRVASFLGLGLALAGLAWANTQMKRQWDITPKSDQPA